MVATFLVNNSDFTDCSLIAVRGSCKDEINTTCHSPALTIISIPGEHTTIASSLCYQGTIG